MRELFGRINSDLVSGTFLDGYRMFCGVLPLMEARLRNLAAIFLDFWYIYCESGRYCILLWFIYELRMGCVILGASFSY